MTTATLTPGDAELQAGLDAAAAALGLKIPAESRAGVLAYFRLAARMAEQVQGLPLTVADEGANVFVPVAPEQGT